MFILCASIRIRPDDVLLRLKQIAPYACMYYIHTQVCVYMYVTT